MSTAEDENLARQMEEEGRQAIAQHAKIVEFLVKSLNETLKHSSIIIVTHTPVGLYKVDYVGNLHKDELNYGLDIAKKLLI